MGHPIFTYRLYWKFKPHNIPFKCIVVEDACATKNLEFKGGEIRFSDVHSAFMAALAAVYARMIPLEQFAEREA
jgi:hypothetical protein